MEVVKLDMDVVQPINICHLQFTTFKIIPINTLIGVKTEITIRKSHVKPQGNGGLKVSTLNVCIAPLEHGRGVIVRRVLVVLALLYI